MDLKFCPLPSGDLRRTKMMRKMDDVAPVQNGYSMKSSLSWDGTLQVSLVVVGATSVYEARLPWGLGLSDYPAAGENLAVQWA